MGRGASFETRSASTPQDDEVFEYTIKKAVILRSPLAGVSKDASTLLQWTLR